MSLSPGGEPVTDYRQLLEELLTEVNAARLRAGLAVNAERTLLSWRSASRMRVWSRVSWSIRSECAAAATRAST